MAASARTSGTSAPDSSSRNLGSWASLRSRAWVAARERARLRRAVLVDAREVVDFRVIVFLVVVFFGLAWVAVADCADAMSTVRPRHMNAVRTHQTREVFEKPGKITGNPLRDSWLQNVSAF